MALGIIHLSLLFDTACISKIAQFFKMEMFKGSFLHVASHICPSKESMHLHIEENCSIQG